MKKNGIRAAALLLAACMVLSLAACGKKGGGDTQQLSGMVYVPEFVDCGLEDIRYVNQVCSDGKYIYCSADVLGEEVETLIYVAGRLTQAEVFPIQREISKEMQEQIIKYFGAGLSQTEKRRNEKK